MPWNNPTLEQLRSQNRDNVTAQLRSGPMIPNSVLRVMSDSNASLAYLTLLYLQWLSLQLLPDTAEGSWLGRQGNIWVGGRKAATFASATGSITGIGGVPIPQGTQASIATPEGPFVFQTTAEVTLGNGPTSVSIAALGAGATEIEVGTQLTLSTAIAGANAVLTITAITDGVDQETDDELRARVLDRIREPPMGGDAFDYVEWATDVPGVTRAWCSPNEMGVGTITVRFMMDDLRATTNPLTNGFPNSTDIANVLAYLSTVRPVAIKDFFVEAPLPEAINFTISGLNGAAGGPDSALQAAIAANVTAMLAVKAMPASAINGVGQSAQTIYAAWVSDAILSTPGVNYFDLVMIDHVMPTNGSMGVLGTITYE